MPRPDELERTEPFTDGSPLDRLVKQHRRDKSDGNPLARQLIDLERDLRDSLRGGYLFGNFDEPLDAASMRVVRVIQQRISDLPCECTDPTPDGARCRACGCRLPTET